MPRLIKIKFQNGIDSQIAYRDILNELTGEYRFEESNDPDFILFGPYGIDIPPPGKYVRIGYFCENIRPDLSVCDWAFGVPLEEEVNHPRYKRIQWHALNPQKLIKPADYNAEEIFKSKKGFCNFLYGNKVPYREAFFKQLSKYKKVGAPGLSMNNMPGIDHLYTGGKWERKRQFLSNYKFTIAFENYIYPGYQTEKLYDAMLADSIPIYCGDPNITYLFNSKAFINTADYINTGGKFTRWLEQKSQSNFIDILPQYYHNPMHRLQRKLKAIGRSAKMKLQFANLDFSPLIERIIELDKDDDKYIEMLKQPWFNNEGLALQLSNKKCWEEIFNNPK